MSVCHLGEHVASEVFCIGYAEDGRPKTFGCTECIVWELSRKYIEEYRSAGGGDL
jgi:hypothetical protein